MDKQAIIAAILSKDAAKITEAKAALKAILDSSAAKFRAESTKFVAKTMFESEHLDERAAGSNTVQHLALQHAKATPEQRKSVETVIAQHHGDEALKHIKAHTQSASAFSKALYRGSKADIQKHANDAHNHIESAKSASAAHKAAVAA